MRRIMLLLALAACGGNRGAEATPGPASGGRTLTAIDPDLSGIAKAAARSLQPASDGKVRFAGVFVGGRSLAALTDTVARAIGATQVGTGDGRVPYTIGPVGSGVGDASRRDATYTLSSFRVKDDMAFVGGDARSAAEPDGAICIVLVRNGNSWLVKQTSVIRNPKSCGPLVF